MPAQIIDGRAIARTIRDTVHTDSQAFSEANGRAPSLVALAVGDDPASLTYARAKGRAAEKVGLAYRLDQLPADADTSAIVARVEALCADAAVDALMVELPLPEGRDARRVQAAIDPARDADGVHPINLGRLLSGADGPRPATAGAVMLALAAAGTPLQGAEAVVVGRSDIVGKPAALLLLAEHATVTVCHSRTRDLPAVARRADVLVAATGVPDLIGAAHVKPGATVIDVGTTWVEDGDGGRLAGDVAYDAVREVAGAVTPVPGGIGPVTTATVLRNAMDLAMARAGMTGA